MSKAGGQVGRWRGDGKELFYLNLEGKVMAVAVQTSPQVQFGRAQELFDAKGGVVRFAVTSGGQRFLMPIKSREPR